MEKECIYCNDAIEENNESIYVDVCIDCVNVKEIVCSQ